MDGKLRSSGNRIGSVGEAAFQLHATKQGLLPTKVAVDVGVDFLCQIEGEQQRVGGSRPVLGTVAAFAVRTTSRTNGRIRLTRKDATALLRMEVPIGIGLVQLIDGTATHYHRIVDTEFAIELAEFLDSDRSSLSLTPGRCREGAGLRDDVLEATMSGQVERRRVAVAQQRLGRKLPIVSLEVRRDERGDLTIVSALQLYDYFEQLDENDRWTLYLATFGAPALQQSRLADLSVREDIVAELEHLPTPYVIGGSVVYAPRELRVEGPAGTATCRMLYTRNGNHHGYTHAAGFALTISDRRRRNGVWVHELATLADPDVALDLADAPELWAFLEACQPGAVLVDDAIENWRFDVEDFGRLDRFAFFAERLRRASSLTGCSSRIAALRDALDDESMETIAWLGALATERERIPKPSFVINAPEDEDLVFESGRWRVPTLANTAQGSVVAWLRCNGDWIMRDGEVRGVRTREILDVELDVRPERSVKLTMHPEFVFDRRLIAMAATDQGLVHLQSVAGRGPEELEPEI